MRSQFLLFISKEASFLGFHIQGYDYCITIAMSSLGKYFINVEIK